VEEVNDVELQHIVELLDIEKGKEFVLGTNGILRFKNKVCIASKPKLRKMILEEGHKSHLRINPGMTKMYKDLKESFWWNRMKKDIVKFVAPCLVCQKGKIEHPRSKGMLQ